ncbi:hypothetical protein [Nocardia brasiliensis]|nr:hypothetical protein [Nocardia brasiliensis]
MPYPANVAAQKSQVGPIYANCRPPAQTPGAMFIINMVISGLHSYAGLN